QASALECPCQTGPVGSWHTGPSARPPWPYSPTLSGALRIWLWGYSWRRDGGVINDTTRLRERGFSGLPITSMDLRSGMLLPITTLAASTWADFIVDFPFANFVNELRSCLALHKSFVRWS